jgi:hypothetical protein
MPGAEAAFDGLLAVVIGGLLVARDRARLAGREVSVATAIATGIVLGLVTGILAIIPASWIIGAP